MKYVESNPLKNEGLTAIDSVATSEGASGSPGRLQEVGVNPIDYETCNDMYDGDNLYSVVLCVKM